MGDYIDVLGHPTWVHDDGGDRPPLLLLHGGLGNSDGWSHFRPLLGDRYRLVMFDRRGHGRTSDTADEFHHSTMADEAAAVIEALGLAPVDAVGYSDGGAVLLHLARKRPELLRTMVLLAVNYHIDALEPGAIAAFEALLPVDSPVAAAYGQVSPDGPDHWTVVAAKGRRLALEEPTFTLDDLSTIRIPTLVLAADDDKVAAAHTASLYDALPNAQLAIVPNTSHGIVFEKPALVAQLISDFLDQPQRAETIMPARRRPPADVTTWHHGLMARWWANFNVDGPEIAFFRADVVAGQPALDVGCGNGRLLVPWVAEGLDVDGVDPSADMIEACRAAVNAAARTREPLLAVQPVHRLDLPRRYGAIVMCGAFGLGGTREQDLEGLRRIHAHLLPGGVLALDYEVNEFDPERWRAWRPRPATDTPPNPDDRRLAPDGFHYALRHRVTDIDLDAGRVVREMQAWQWQDDELVAHETHALVVNVYTREQIVAALGEAGFAEVSVVGGYHGGEPTGDEKFLVYRAVKDRTA